MSERLRVLCVDDDEAVLDGLALSLRQRFEVSTAVNGQDALRLLWQQPFPIVLSDMRMPGMSGAALLAEVRRHFPDTVRLLLTGYADMEAAAAAINEGQIFRFLTKPCPPAVLLRALEDAAAQYRLLSAERELLERTLRGAVQALTDVLSLKDPGAFGRASQVQKLALALAKEQKLRTVWPLELAALLAPLGRISLPPETQHREEQGETLTEQEQQAIAKVPEVTLRLLAPIPRLEPVREILRAAGARQRIQAAPPATDEERQWQQCGRILRLAMDFVAREARGDSTSIALAELAAHRRDYGDELIASLDRIKGAEAEHVEVRALPMRMLQPGMVLVADLYTQAGQRLVPRGYEVTAGFVERLQNLRPGSLREPIRVMLPRPRPEAEAASAAA